MKTILAAITAISVAAVPLFASAQTQPTNWIEVSKTENHTYSLKSGSFDISENQQGQKMASFVGQTIDVSTKTTFYNKYFIPLSDCTQGFGKLSSYRLDGTHEGDNDFVSDGASVASRISSFICGVYTLGIEEAAKEQEREAKRCNAAILAAEKKLALASDKLGVAANSETARKNYRQANADLVATRVECGATE